MELGLQILAVIVGMAICTGAGLFAMTPDIEQPKRFIPIYLVSIVLFVGGLFLIVWPSIPTEKEEQPAQKQSQVTTDSGKAAG